MPHYLGLIRFLVAAPHRVNSAGEMLLTTAEAAFLRACEFPSAAAGPWKIPLLPIALIRAYGLPPTLAAVSEAPPTVAVATPAMSLGDPYERGGRLIHDGGHAADSIAAIRQPVWTIASRNPTGTPSVVVRRTSCSPGVMAARAVGISYEDLCVQLVAAAALEPVGRGGAPAASTTEPA